jgi:two-component system sensor histidine kinase CpxA
MTWLRMSLYRKVLFWFLLNLLLLAVTGLGFMRMQFRLSLDWMLAGPGGERIEQLADSLNSELAVTTEPKWDGVLARHQAETGTTLALFGNDGLQKLGQKLEVPKEVSSRLISRRQASDMQPPPRPGAKASKERQGAPHKPRFMLRTDDPTRYWAAIDLSLAYGEGDARRPMSLVIVTDSLTAGGMFFNPWPWAALVGIALGLSALAWLPFVAGITHDLRKLNDAARRVAHGEFEVRLPEARQDELGELACSVNAMAQQLIDYVEQQRRLTRDVAHELCSPLARMQMALGVIELRADPDVSDYVKDIDEELQHMAKLVEEVLAFSKAQTLTERVQPEDVNLADLVKKVIAREASGFNVQVDVPAEMQLHTRREALDRAIGNVLRNAVRYASQGGPICITARQHHAKTIVQINDEGPGVPPDALSRLFEPFFRPEAARARDTGGSGLGLAIVKRCIEACGGTVRALNREPLGLEVVMEIPSS